MNHVALTVEFDEPTAASLRNLTQRWGVPPQEAVARAVRATAQDLPPRPSGEHPLHVFRQLHRAAGITAETAARWKDTVHDGRR